MFDINQHPHKRLNIPECAADKLKSLSAIHYSKIKIEIIPAPGTKEENIL